MTAPELRVRLEAVTPIFLSGARPDEPAELRLPSVKGVLRFWYRALDADYRSGEPVAFGDTKGQSSVLLWLDRPVVGSERWNGGGSADPKPYDEYTVVTATQAINGIAYLGYTLNLGQNRRRGLAANKELCFTAVVHPRVPSAEQERVRRAWIAALWCLAHFGGLGSRARRGLGSTPLMELAGWPEAAELFREPSDADNPEAWLARLAQRLETLRDWYPDRPPADHPVLDGNARILLLRAGHDNWEDALNAAGAIFQGFRQRSSTSGTGSGQDTRRRERLSGFR